MLSPKRVKHRKQHRSEEHTSELQSHSNISYAVFCLKKKKPELLDFLKRVFYTEETVRTDFGLCRFHAEYRIGDSMFIFFFNDTATTEIYTLLYTLSLHDALPILNTVVRRFLARRPKHGGRRI